MSNPTITERIRPDGVTERIAVFANMRRARIVPSVVGMSEGEPPEPVYGYAVQLLDCRNDEHENRLFPRREGLDEKGLKKALADISKLKAPTPHKYDR